MSRPSLKDRQRGGQKGHSPRFRGFLPGEYGAGPEENILRTVALNRAERCRGSIRFLCCMKS